MPINGVNQHAMFASVIALKETHNRDSQLSTGVVAVANTPRTFWLQREKNHEQIRVRETLYHSANRKTGRDYLYLRMPAGQAINALSQSGVKMVSHKDSGQIRNAFSVISVQRNGAQELQFSVPVDISKQQLDDFLTTSTDRMKKGKIQDVQIDAILAAKTIAELEINPEKFSEKFTLLELQTIKIRYKSLLEQGKALLREGR
ncbi:hypothetical protein [Erwinia sp. V71]|uniref:hypothetical protein n=1 Tax=Erwinia sp. V71 TaxID=3369424 RepID=UPI003F605189